MASRSTLVKACMVLYFIPFLVSVVASESYTFELTMKYFTNVSMICDHPHLNITNRTDVTSLSWIFPDGEMFNGMRKPSSHNFLLTGPSPHNFLLKGPSPHNFTNLDAYNLTALRINDPVFGYYICVVVYQSPTDPMSVIKWGLNVDGADFSELMKTYQDNAMIGGIAAAVMLAAIATVCLIWHFRYSNRDNTFLVRRKGKLTDDVDLVGDSQVYHNNSYIPQDEMIEIEIKNDVEGKRDTVKTGNI